MPASRIAVVVPCHNEAQTIGTVIGDFRSALPDAEIVICDNNSTDDTANVAREHGARVVSERRAGKGHAVRRLFSDVEADCYILIDGDATYEAAAAPAMTTLVLRDGIDMVVGKRISGAGGDEYRRGHRLGNAVLSWIFRVLFRFDQITDTLSGYRVMSRRFVKSFPSSSRGFEIEAELNAHAATIEVPACEVSTAYSERPEGSESKLSTYKDGVRILRRNLSLFRDARPFYAFVLLAIPWLVLAAVGLGIAIAEYATTGLVLRYPTMIIGSICLVIGLVTLLMGSLLERVARNRIEAVKLAYLAIPAPVGASRTNASGVKEIYLERSP